MAKPLRSEDPTPKSVQFSHFGVLNDGTRSKGAAFTSIGVNVTIVLLILILGAVVKTSPAVAKRLTELTLPPEPPPAVKPPPPPPPVVHKPLPTPPKLAEPKIVEKLPEIKPLPEPPKPLPPTPAPPKAVTPPPAPVHVNLGNPKAAAIPNNLANPSAVRLGSADNPLKNNTGPAVSNVNLGQSGMKGMSGPGLGANAAKVDLGNGAAGSKNMQGVGHGPVVIAGLANGVSNSQGKSAGAPINVSLGHAPPPPTTGRPAIAPAVAAAPPKLIYKPTPAYTEEARSMHLEGSVSVRIRVAASGAVQVLGVVQGLGHGLDQSAVQATQATRFKPAMDATGNPVDWEGVVKVNFQMS